MLVTCAVIFTASELSGPAAEAEPRKPHPAVLLLVFDEWPLDAILGPDGKIDPGRYPNLAAFAKGATWYPNATTVYDSTPKAVPAILDAQLPRAHSLPTFKSHPRTVFDLFGRHGYRTVREESVTSICPPRWCPGATDTAPSIHAPLYGPRKQHLERFLDRVHLRRGRFYMRHTLLPHGPYLYLPSGRRMRPDWRDPIPGMNSSRGFSDVALTQHKQQRLRLQLGFVDAELGRLFRRLRREHTYDGALIALTADHGISSQLGVNNRRLVTDANVHEIAPVPMIVKAPEQRDGRIDRSWIRTIDLVPTIAHDLHWKMPYDADGRPDSAAVTRNRRSVTIERHDFGGVITISAAEMLRRRAALRRDQLGLLGSGDWASLYRLGPHRELVGGRVASLHVARRGPVRATVAATLVDAELLRRAKPRSSLWPTEIAGTITGAPADAHRDFAIAVGNRIEAVGRSFSFAGTVGEHFTAMVPERSLHAGRNLVRVFEVGPRRGLIPLGADR